MTKRDNTDFERTVENYAMKFKVDYQDEEAGELIETAKGLIEYDLQFVPSKTQVSIIEAQHSFKSNTGEGQEQFNNLQHLFKQVGSTQLAEKFIEEKAADEAVLNVAPSKATGQSLEQLWNELNTEKLCIGLSISSQPPEWV